jgi:RimJ/RimL family protein N-acetyltransferase
MDDNPYQPTHSSFLQSRFQWQVLDWNQKAIDLYRKIGAKELKEWITYRMDAAAIEKFLNS